MSASCLPKAWSMVDVVVTYFILIWASGTVD